jgi:hypothetical protein
MRTRSWHRLLPAAVVALAPMVVWAQGGIETGPTQQRMPWRAAGSTLNSIVEVNAGGFFGTGSVVCRMVGTDGNLWAGVLTADHVASPGGFTGQTIKFGDNAAQGTFGGGNNAWYRQYNNVDIAMVAVNFGANNAANPNLAFFNSIQPLTVTVAPGSHMGRQFTEVGYGGTGTFAAGGMNGMGADGNKRFQNNQISGSRNITGQYTYASVEWSFDPAPAAGFLVAEGLSFGGDSGGPYLTNSPDVQAVAAFNRPGQNNWPGGDMAIFKNAIFAVHTYGNSTPAGFNAYTAVGGAYTYGGGVPITSEIAGWVNEMCMQIPAPASLPVLALSLMWCARRRRG